VKKNCTTGPPIRHGPRSFLAPPAHSARAQSICIARPSTGRGVFFFFGGGGTTASGPQRAFGRRIARIHRVMTSVSSGCAEGESSPRVARFRRITIPMKIRVPNLRAQQTQWKIAPFLRPRTGHKCHKAVHFSENATLAPAALLASPLNTQWLSTAGHVEAIFPTVRQRSYTKSNTSARFMTKPRYRPSPHNPRSSMFEMSKRSFVRFSLLSAHQFKSRFRYGYFSRHRHRPLCLSAACRGLWPEITRISRMAYAVPIAFLNVGSPRHVGRQLSQRHSVLLKETIGGSDLGQSSTAPLFVTCVSVAQLILVQTE